ncbi:uncharacterized protein LOC112503538 [Cynara cardunculus var. scolymus]|uniref:uncharacterized protein LOC112503538 n=1 Tax=Cynara cardunculus var. scolymus TaxID=59895 RepID=UPI000D62F877|nr:uncharacterized protein LOC112503538 [Cynara cardunculus var. scolymus]
MAGNRGRGRPRGRGRGRSQFQGRGRTEIHSKQEESHSGNAQGGTAHLGQTIEPTYGEDQQAHNSEDTLTDELVDNESGPQEIQSEEEPNSVEIESHDNQFDFMNEYIQGGEPQASRNWYYKFTTFLSNLNFCRSKDDHSLFMYGKEEFFFAILIYVDDIIIVGNKFERIQDTKTQLDEAFNIKDLGPLKYFLGIEVAKTSNGLVLSQRKYILDILKDSGMMGCRPSPFPIEQNLNLDKGENETQVDDGHNQLVGRLLYLQATRPDITYAVNILSQFVADPCRNHMEAVNRVLIYLKGIPGQGILLPRAEEPVLTAFCDSDCLGCPYMRR